MSSHRRFCGWCQLTVSSGSTTAKATQTHSLQGSEALCPQTARIAQSSLCFQLRNISGLASQEIWPGRLGKCDSSGFLWPQRPGAWASLCSPGHWRGGTQQQSWPPRIYCPWRKTAAISQALTEHMVYVASASFITTSLRGATPMVLVLKRDCCWDWEASLRKWPVRRHLKDKGLWVGEAHPREGKLASGAEASPPTWLPTSQPG